MPKTKVVCDESNDILKHELLLAANYMHQKIVDLQTHYGVTNPKMAEIVGYERSAWHRLQKNKKFVRLESLIRLSVHFKIPMSFWFRSLDDVQPLMVLPAPHCVCKGEAQLTRQAVKQIAALSAIDKGRLCRFLDSYSNLEMLVGLTELFSRCSHEKAEKIIEAVRTILAESTIKAAQ